MLHTHATHTHYTHNNDWTEEHREKRKKQREIPCGAEWPHGVGEALNTHTHTLLYDCHWCVHNFCEILLTVVKRGTCWSCSHVLSLCHMSCRYTTTQMCLSCLCRVCVLLHELTVVLFHPRSQDHCRNADTQCQTLFSNFIPISYDVMKNRLKHHTQTLPRSVFKPTRLNLI